MTSYDLDRSSEPNLSANESVMTGENSQARSTATARAGGGGLTEINTS